MLPMGVGKRFWPTKTRSKTFSSVLFATNMARDCGDRGVGGGGVVGVVVHGVVRVVIRGELCA